jgi:hypothetical protein
MAMRRSFMSRSIDFAAWTSMLLWICLLLSKWAQFRNDPATSVWGVISVFFFIGFSTAIVYAITGLFIALLSGLPTPKSPIIYVWILAGSVYLAWRVVRILEFVYP